MRETQSNALRNGNGHAGLSRARGVVEALRFALAGSDAGMRRWVHRVAP